MHRDIPNDGSNDGLDAAIREALRTDANSERLARLERYWSSHFQRQVRRRRALQSMLLAAAAMAAVAAFFVAGAREDGKQITEARSSPASVGGNSASPAGLPDADYAIESPLPGRAPTGYEQFVFTARMTERKPAITLASRLDALISQIAQAPGSDVKQVLDASGIQPPDAEPLLLCKLRQAAPGEQEAVLRLLAICGSQRSIPALLWLSRNREAREAALITIEQIVGTENLSQVASRTTDFEIRRSLMLRLLTSNTESALLGYLSLVRAEPTRSDALWAAKDAPQTSIDRLLALLDHEDKQVRVSAAIVLGHVNGPSVTESLIARVTDKPAESPGAWMALVACRGEFAEEFFAYAAQRPQLLGYFYGARAQWAQMTP